MGGEAYPEVVGDDGDAAEVVVVVVEEAQLFGGDVDGVVWSEGSVEEDVGAVYALEALEDGGFEGFEVFKGEFVVEGNVEAVVLLADGNHGRTPVEMGFPRGGGSDTGTLWVLTDYSEIAGKLLWHEFVLPQ